MRWEFFAASAAPWVVSWLASSGCCAAYCRASVTCCGDSFECGNRYDVGRKNRSAECSPTRGKGRDGKRLRPKTAGRVGRKEHRRRQVGKARTRRVRGSG